MKLTGHVYSTAYRCSLFAVEDENLFVTGLRVKCYQVFMQTSHIYATLW